MPFSNEQLKAINERDKNIIVSAGAGSGKTAVLTERISQILLSGHTLDELLVLTFTNKAAAEMKERVRKKILNNKDLLIHKDKVDAANITTFDAYCQFIVNKYGYLLNIAEINVADSVYLNIKEEAILDDIILSHFTNDKDNIDKFYSIFPNKDDSELKNIVMNMYRKIDIIIDKNEFYNTYFDKYYNDKFIEKSFNDYYLNLYNELKKALIYKDKIMAGLEEEKEYIYSNEMNDDAISLDYFNFVNDISELLESNIKINDFINLLTSLYPTNPKISQKGVKNNLELKDIKDGFKEERESFNKIVNEVRKRIITKEDAIDEFNYNKEIAKFILSIIKEFDDAVFEFKKNNNIYSFMDIQKLAIDLLKIDSVQNEIKNSLYEILIDEYQDTSYIQEYFINLIANNNVYVVGDIKQGIYRFRNAEPELFNYKYNNYDVSEKYNKNSLGLRIDLTKNFRSRKEVLNNINLIFDNLMTLEYGSAAFKESHEMVYGLVNYDSNKEDSFNYDMEILSYDKQIKNEDDESSEIDASTQEIEANIIASDIISKMKDGFRVYDADLKKLRDAKYSDFCILIDRSTSFEIIKQILESKNIPVSIEADIKLNTDNITLVLSSLVNLVVLTNKHKFNSDYYHYFTSIARSYLFMMDDDLIFDIVTGAQENKKYLNKGPLSNVISDKINLIASKVNEYSNSMIFQMLLDEFEVIKKLPLIGDTQSRLVIIDKIKTAIDMWSSFGESLETIAEYIKVMLNDDNNKYSVDTTGSNAVRIMTIHKSKGLEFPVCYFPMLMKKFLDSVKDNVGFNIEYGMYFKKDKPSMIKYLSKKREDKLDLSEKIRLFYVALTRAREKMILICPKFDKEINYASDINSFYDMLIFVKENIKDYIKNIDLSNYTIDDSYKKRRLLKSLKYHDKLLYNDNSYFGDIINKNRISKEVIEVLSDKEQENIDLGLKYHRYMELLDFNNVNTNNIKEGKIKEDIEKVLKNDIMINLSKAKTYHEHEFIFVDKSTNETFHGIIDLLAVYNDHIDIIDYKLYHIDDKAYDRQLSIYKKYIQSISNLNINCYLLSLALNEVREVKC